MKAQAPGKLLLTGAYAVLEGAPALVLAVDRYAVADNARVESAPSREVEAAFGSASAPAADASELYIGACKLGLGSSAAVLVASLAARALAEGRDLAASAVRAELFAAARAAHAAVQGGGSGVDVAASVYGGVLQYQLRDGVPCIVRTALPRDVVWAAFFTGQSARTSALRAKVDALKACDGARWQACFDRLGDASRAGVDAVRRERGELLVRAARAMGEGLAALGAAADAPIVPRAVGELARLAERQEAAFLPSGAGGGDVAVFVGIESPAARFFERAKRLGMTPLELNVDEGGVRPRHPKADVRT